MTGTSAAVRLRIERLGRRGEGVAQHEGRAVFVPYALPGEIVEASVEGERGVLIAIESPSGERIDPFCEHFGDCGGCAVQALEHEAYRRWKRELVCAALARADIVADVSELVDAHGAGRRRAVFHARVDATREGPRVHAGFMRARSHDIVAIRACPILCPELAGAPALAEAIAHALAEYGKPLDIVIAATQTGADVDIRGLGRLPDPARLRLARLAGERDLARLSNHGDIIVERRPPQLAIGAAMAAPPPGAFMQATAAGEETLARLALEACGSARRIADLFAGVGAFALRLAAIAPVHAVESDGAALQALARAAARTPSLSQVTAERRDLFRRPLLAAELAAFDCVVFDPPRAGAQEQVHQIAASDVARVVAVSCNPVTFARDARILVDAGFTIGRVTPVDQFRHSPHVEIVAAFSRRSKPARRRRLLG